MPNFLSSFNSPGATQSQPDFTMNTFRPSSKKEITNNLKVHDRLLVASPAVQRKATLAQLYYLDYYRDLLTYLHQRKLRKDSILETSPSPAALQSYNLKERALLRKRRVKLVLDNFHIITQVGQGGYGEVYLARRKGTGEVVALKKMRKATLAKMGEVRHVLVERDILTSARSDWLVRLLYAFQDDENIFLAMEFVGGGDFRTLLNNSGVLKEEHARFYIAEMFCAVDALHQLGYIHRDLKPENFLVDNTGHVKLTDFGLACGALNPARIESLKHKLDEVKGKDPIIRSTVDRKSIFKNMRSSEPRTANSCVGSSEYMAPEVLRGKGYSHSVDYWSLGCILFEFLSGYPPFSGATQEESWTNLKNWTKVLKRPHYTKEEDLVFNLTDEAWDAVIRLISHASTRASSLDDVKRHPFYATIPWSHLRERKAPFVPQLENETDAGYFDSFTDPADMAKYKDVKDKQRSVEAVEESKEGFNRGVWVGFTFKKPNAKDTTIQQEDDNAFATMF